MVSSINVVVVAEHKSAVEPALSMEKAQQMGKSADESSSCAMAFGRAR